VVSNDFVHQDGFELQGIDLKTVTMFHAFYSTWGDHVVQLTCGVQR
jgi:hypothetical protein